MKRRVWVFSFLVVFSFISINQIYAGTINLNLTVTASNGTNIGIEEYVLSGDAANGFEWVNDGRDYLIGDGKLLGAIEYLKLNVWEDPAVSLEFHVVAFASPINFTITAAKVSFPPIDNPVAYATAGVTLTDRNQNGASITGLFDGGKLYQAVYNDTSAYANLVSSFTAGIRQTVTQSEGKPVVGTEIIPATLNNILSSFSFALSAYDSASGTSYFEVVPEPATLCLLGLGSLLLLNRKNRK